MLTEKEIKQIKEELDNCKNPLYFFHDDPDGLCSFLLLYRYVREGHGTLVKTTPKIDKKFLKKVEEYNPDKIFIVDIAMVDQDFLDEVNIPVIWIDHHEPLDRHKVKYFNPRKHKTENNVPATALCYEVVKQDLWIAAIGAIGDWYYPEYCKEFSEKYPDLLPKGMNNPGKILYETKLGLLSRIFSFILKGKIPDAAKCFKIMTRINDPYEILEQKTPQGSFIYKKFETINKLYEELLKEAVKNASDDKLLVYQYQDNKMSFTGDLANELLYRYPHKVIIIAREKDGEMRMSLRSTKKPIRPVLEKALFGLEAYGGGHEYACGACVKKNEFNEFLDRIRKGF